MLRVLHIINGLGTGGAERSLAEMLPLMRQAGVDSTIACLHRKPEGVHESVEAAGFPVHVIGSQRLDALRKIRLLVNHVRPDVVHTTIFEADLLGRLGAAGKPARVLSSLVNTTYDGVRVADEQLSAAKVRAAQAVDGFTARHMTDHFHAITAAVRDSAVKHLGIAPDKVTVVERGRSLERLGEPSEVRRHAARTALGLPHDAEVVLNVGRQEPQKAQAVLLEALAKLAPSRPNLILLQAGRQGKSTPELDRLVAQTGLTERVRFLGHRDDIGNLHAASDVFAFPSVYEGLGGSVLEAMAMLTPVVVTDVPALLEVVEHGRGGIVVSTGDVSALASGIERLLENQSLSASLAASARSIFDSRFTLERSATRMVQLYSDLVGDTNPWSTQP